MLDKIVILDYSLLNLMGSELNNDITSSATAHELRNPINNILLSCEQLHQELKELNVPEEKVLIYLQIIKRNSLRVNDLVSDLFSAPEQGKAEEKSLERILEDALAHAADRIKLNGIKLEKLFLAKKTLLFQNPVMLKLAFLNIIMNAIESMEGSGGVLKILVEEKGLQTEVSISDTGIGIPESAIEKIFIRHYSKKERGLGMGLTISKEVFTRNKANIIVESELGRGTTFVISFNNVQDPPAGL
jgi:signal transduction histidine kinase